MAAAIAYGFNNKRIEQYIVVDLGATTLSVSLLSTVDGTVETKAATADPQLGGEDFDDNLMQYFVGLVEQRNVIVMMTRALVLDFVCQTAKHKLSTANRSSRSSLSG